MKCEDCFHYDVCDRWDDWNDKPYKDGYGGYCQNYSKFKDKLHIAELPCKVGDEIYCITGAQIYKAKVHCVSCGGKYSTDWQFHIYDCDNDNACLILKDYKKDWFLSKEEAEKKLMELNGNGRN